MSLSVNLDLLSCAYAHTLYAKIFKPRKFRLAVSWTREMWHGPDKHICLSGFFHAVPCLRQNKSDALAEKENECVGNLV